MVICTVYRCGNRGRVVTSLCQQRKYKSPCSVVTPSLYNHHQTVPDVASPKRPCSVFKQQQDDWKEYSESRGRNYNNNSTKETNHLPSLGSVSSVLTDPFSVSLIDRIENEKDVRHAAFMLDSSLSAEENKQNIHPDDLSRSIPYHRQKRQNSRLLRDRKRAYAVKHAFLQLLNHGIAIMEQHQHQQQQRQQWRQSSSSSSNTDGSASSATGSSSNSSSTQTAPRAVFASPRLSVPNYGPDAERAIRNLQNARKERARAKTAMNVRRALMGNVIICVAKLGAWLSSGSSSLMSEFVHSVVDCGNQSLLLMGLRDSRNAADKLHPYGYGKSIYFWALVSALGTFFLGSGVAMSHSIQELIEPSLNNITWEVWGVLGFSFAVDGWVLRETLKELIRTKPKRLSLYEHIRSVRDPATLAVLLEDGAACAGVLIAIAGIGATQMTGMPIFDGIAGVGISCLLGAMGLVLVRVNHRFLLGQGVDKDVLDGIEAILRNQKSIDNVYSIQSQWTGPETFSFKAEVDFDGTYLAAQLLPRYQQEFKRLQKYADDRQQLQDVELLLCWYAEDVMRAVEREVRHIEAKIRQRYPGAEYIELEPMSKDAHQFAVDNSFEESLMKFEKEQMKQYAKAWVDSKQIFPSEYPADDGIIRSPKGSSGDTSYKADMAEENETNTTTDVEKTFRDDKSFPKQ